MLEVDITRLAVECDIAEFSGSIAERGANASPETWANAKDEAAETPLVTTAADLDTVREYFAEFGAWSREELAGYTPAEMNALLIQYVSGDLREAQSLCPGDGVGDIDWDAYEALAHEGTLSGLLFAAGERVFASITH